MKQKFIEQMKLAKNMVEVESIISDARMQYITPEAAKMFSKGTPSERNEFMKNFLKSTPADFDSRKLITYIPERLRKTIMYSKLVKKYFGLSNSFA